MQLMYIEDVEDLVTKIEQKALVDLIHQLITVLWRRYRLQTIIEIILASLIEYLKARDSWTEVSQHLQSARQAMLELSSPPRREGDSDDQTETNQQI